MVSAASSMADIGSAAKAVPHGKGGKGTAASGFAEMLDSQKSGMADGGDASKPQHAQAKHSGSADGSSSKDTGQKGAHGASDSADKPKAADHGKAKKKQDGASHKGDQNKQAKADKGQAKTDGGRDNKADKKAKGKSDGTDANAAPYALLTDAQTQTAAKPAAEAGGGVPGGKGLPGGVTQQGMAKVIADATATSSSSDKGSGGKSAKAGSDPLSTFESLLNSKDAGDKAGQGGANNTKGSDAAAAVRELSRLGGDQPAQGNGGNGAGAAGNGGGQQSAAPAPLSAPANASANSTASAAPQQPAHLQLSVPMRAQGWNQAFAQRITWMAKQGVQQAQIQLNPRHLGPIQVHLSVDHDQASVQFVAHNPHAREALQAAMPRLKEMMGENGMNLAQSQVAQQGFQQPQQQFGSGSGSGQGGAGSGNGSNAGVAEEDVAAIEGAHLLNGGTSLSAVDYFA